MAPIFKLTVTLKNRVGFLFLLLVMMFVAGGGWSVQVLAKEISAPKSPAGKKTTSLRQGSGLSLQAKPAGNGNSSSSPHQDITYPGPEIPSTSLVGQNPQVQTVAMPCTLKEDVYLRKLSFSDTSLKLPYYTNFNCPSEAVNRAVIVIHGNMRNALDYFNDIRSIVPVLPAAPPAQPPATSGNLSVAGKKKSTTIQSTTTSSTSTAPFSSMTYNSFPEIDMATGVGNWSVSGGPVNTPGHVAPGSTVIVAPKFPLCTSSDCDPEIDPANPAYYYWATDDTWKIGQMTAGALTSAGLGPQRSSFEMMDALVIKLREKYPNIRYYTFVGHSAGGQFVQRYAATTNAMISMQYLGGDAHFVVANPSSYVYLNPERLVDGTWQLPTACSAYNNYKYGLSETSLQWSINSYIAVTGVDLIRVNYPSRKVVYLLGENDTTQADPNSDAGSGDNVLDESCMANLQGPSRRERGEIYFDYMSQFYPGHIHELSLVPGVGHHHHNMLTSTVGRAKILWW